ncbi:MAG: ZIP family metal transporter [Patescibacteria group bacterium]|nr:ZIP family metal transporter [Patescibacteria group bacterium]
MVQAIIYGGITGLSLLIGAWVGITFHLKQKTVAAIMAFGSGVLICALTFGLMEEAFRHGGFDAVIMGFLAGGLVFIAGDYILHVRGGRKHRRQQPYQPKRQSGGQIITLGTVLDGIPESIALGIALFNSTGTGLLMLAAILLSNFPESIASITGLQKEGFSKKRIYLMWASVALVTLLVTVLSYQFLHNLRPNTIGTLEAFAAGAILAMVADSMIPEAYEEGGVSIGLLTVLGFLVAFIISRF